MEGAIKLLFAFLVVFPVPFFGQPAVRPTGFQPSQVRSLRSGTVLPVRIQQTISNQSSEPGMEFIGTLAVDLVENGCRLLPAGTPVTLRVADVQRSGYSNTVPRITIEAVSINLQGENGRYTVPILTNSDTRTGVQINMQRLQSLGNTAAAIVGRYGGGYYPSTYGGFAQPNTYQDARFIAGDVVRLSLNEEMLLQQ